jgi:hypothetical protein
MSIDAPGATDALAKRIWMRAMTAAQYNDRLPPRSNLHHEGTKAGRKIGVGVRREGE